MKKATIIYCKDGIVCVGTDNHIYWSWKYDSIDKYAELNKGRAVAEHLGVKLINLTDLEYKIVVAYRDCSMHDIL